MTLERSQTPERPQEPPAAPTREADSPEPARIPEPWPPPDEADRPAPVRPEPDDE